MSDVAIIGAGPAGLTAAIQLKRYGIPFVLLEKERVGGLLWNANLVENYPGFPEGIPGPALVARFEAQMRRIGVEAERDEVTRLTWEGETFRVETRRTVYRPRYVIVASGTRPRPVPIRLSAEARERVFSDVYPLLGVRGRRVVIVGAGDAAFDQALNLAQKGNSVTVLNRGEQVKCLPLLWTRAMDCDVIVYRAGVRVRRVEASGAANRLRVRCEAEDASEEIEADFLVFAIGREPQVSFLSEGLRAQQERLVRNGRLYFAGDVHNGLFRQTAIAAGDGLRAAMQISMMERKR